VQIVERIEEKASTKTCFANPYASWQRGSNENANGRFRRWIPRSTGLSKLRQPKKVPRMEDALCGASRGESAVIA
jgi:IS30 family transposase